MAQAGLAQARVRLVFSCGGRPVLINAGASSFEDVKHEIKDKIKDKAVRFNELWQ